jgi:hypothetical protein
MSVGLAFARWPWEKLTRHSSARRGKKPLDFDASPGGLYAGCPELAFLISRQMISSDWNADMSQLAPAARAPEVLDRAVNKMVLTLEYNNIIYK